MTTAELRTASNSAPTSAHRH